MVEISLNEVERLVDQLSPQEQARLLGFLAQRVAKAVEHAVQREVSPAGDEAWAEFFRVGDALAASDKPELETLTSAVAALRR